MPYHEKAPRNANKYEKRALTLLIAHTQVPAPTAAARLEILASILRAGEMPVQVRTLIGCNTFIKKDEFRQRCNAHG